MMFVCIRLTLAYAQVHVHCTPLAERIPATLCNEYELAMGQRDLN